MYDGNLIGKLDLESLNKAKEQGKKIGLVQGSWDLFHIGHLKYIKKAKEACDYLIIGMDGDLKIKKRKGNGRPIIPEDERYEFIKLLNVADDIVIKEVDEEKWGLIKSISPDVLIVIKDNYSDKQIEDLEKICGEVKILDRQSETSTSDKIRKITLANQKNKIDRLKEKLDNSIEEFKKRISYSEDMSDEIQKLVTHLYDSTDWKVPVAAACLHNGNWYYGANKADFSLPKCDIDNRTELFYSTVEHAEINLLKHMGDIEKIDSPIYVTLFPCDKCMKVLIEKGIKKIYYLEDHLDRNWSKRSHELAKKAGIETINLLELNKEKEEKDVIDYSSFKYIYPPNAREQEQLDIMMNREYHDEDPLDIKIVNQEVLFETKYWYISKNKFPYKGVAYQFLICSMIPVYSINEMPEEMWTELGKICLKLTDEYNIPGGALCFRIGDCSFSGASLKRLHAHLIQPEEGVKTKFTIGGNKELKKTLKLKKRDD